MQNLDATAWQRDFASGWHCVLLALDLHERDSLPQLTLAFRDALVDHAAKWAQDAAVRPTDGVLERWGDLHDLVPVPDRLYQDVYKRLIQHAGKASAPFLDHYGPLIEPEVVRREGRSVRLFEDLLQSENESGLRWVVRVLTSDDGLWVELASTAQPADVESFKSRVAEYLRRDGTLKELVQEIAAACGVTASEPDEPVHEGSDDARDDNDEQG